MVNSQQTVSYPTSANGIIVLLNSLHYKSLEVRNTSAKMEKIVAKSKNFKKMWCWAISRGQTDAGSSQKRLLPFRVLLRFRIDPQFPHIYIFFFALYREKFRFPAKKNFSLPTQSAIVYHMRSNYVVRYMTNQSTSNVLSEAENLISSDIHVTRNYMELTE